MTTDRRYTIVDRVSECRRMVDDLLSCDVITADSEGVHLGKDGPLTLLQVGRSDGHVYLFDIQTGGPDMFTVGRLQELLESETVLKVMHGSSNDSLALYSQFSVQLVNVFDIQTAQMTLEKHQGRQLPSKMKLGDLCGTYLPDVTMLDKKGDIQIKWDKTEGEYWAKRPMTSEMIDYACSDLRLLIPVYEQLQRCLERSGVREQFQRDMLTELRRRWDDNTKEEERKQSQRIINEIFNRMAVKYRDTPNIEVINDEDEIQALKRTHLQDIENYPEAIRQLKHQLVKKDILEVRDEINDKGSLFVPQQLTFSLLSAGKNHSDPSIVSLCIDLWDKCNNKLKQDMAKKYDLTTPLKHITFSEKQVLRSLKPKSADDSAFHPVVLRLYWMLMEAELEQEMQNFAENRASYTVRNGYIGKVKFYISGQGVPTSIKTKARRFIDRLQESGKIPPPQRKPGRGRRY